MREKVTAARLQEFMKALGFAVVGPARIFLVGGASAVWCGWRDSTIDIDLKAIPDSDEVLRTLPALKERLRINIELASPDDFIPELPSWQERSRFIAQEGRLTFLHYDFYAQALAKIERGHQIDLLDVREMIQRGMVDPERMLGFFSQIEEKIYKYPAINREQFRKAVDRVVRESQRLP